MDNKSAIKGNVIKGILSVVVLIIVVFAVSNGNAQSSKEMELTTIRGYIEAVSDHDTQASKEYILSGISDNVKLLSYRDNRKDFKYIKFKNMKKEKRFKSRVIHFKNGSRKLYLKGSIMKVEYEIINEHGDREQRESVFSMVKTGSGNYKIIDIQSLEY